MSEHSCCGGGCHQSNASQCNSCCQSLPEESKNPLQVEISMEEEVFLKKLAVCPFLPMANYMLLSSQSHHLRNVALSHIFLESGDETIAEIKEMAEVIHDLEERDIISVDFDAPLEGTDTSLFTNSVSYGLLLETIKDGASRPDFLFDQSEIEYGSVCLTALGDIIIDQLEYL